MARTAKDMIAEIRSMLDEQNESSLDDKVDILPSLNRGYDYAIRVLSSHYVAPLLSFSEVTTDGSAQEYDIPRDAFEDRLLKVEVNNRGNYAEVMRLDYKDLTFYDVPTKTGVPYYYTIVGRKYRLAPPPNGTYPLRVWYAKHPGPIVEEQGAVTVIGSNYVILDEVGEDLSTSGTSAYVNIIDSETGDIRCTMQIQSIVGSKVTFKSVPDRTIVYNRTVVGTLPATISKDDLICSAEGSSIPLMRSTVTNFLVQFSVAEMTRKLGGDSSMEDKARQEFEQQVQKAWAGRERYTRVKKRSKEWGSNGRRFWFGQS
jgi:hypothetical protein